jgi:chaperonin GroEL
MTKKYCDNTGLHDKILSGANKLADNVASTLGPKGRNVILQQKGKRPIITKDGVTIARFVDLEDEFENVGAQVIKQASEETNSDAGDGTTTATVLARAVLLQSQKYLKAGVSPVELKRGMDKATAQIVANIQEFAQPISSEEDIAHVASISANNDNTIGKLVALAVDRVGKDGSITVEEARSVDTSLDFVEGFRVDSGYISPQFVNDERRGTIRHEDCYVLVTDEAIETVEQILPTLELVSRENRPLLIVAENVEGQALAALIMNAIRGTMRVAAIKAPRYGEERRNIMQDLATSIGASFITRTTDTTLTNVKLCDLGIVKSVEVTKGGTTFVGGNGDFDEIEKRIENLKVEVAQTDNLHEAERLQERVTCLASGVAIIRAGGLSEVEMIEKKHRIEDALEAVRSAQLEGIVPGGGVALLRACTNLEVVTENEDQALGVKIIVEAVQEPIKQMAANAGLSPDVIVDKVLEADGSTGINFYTGELTDLTKAGVIDPAKVTRCALQNAVSVASTLITTNFAIIET